MSPYTVWRKNNWRFDLRKYTRTFESKFKTKNLQITEPGKLYAITYKTSFLLETDKHHVTPIILSFGRFKDEEGRSYVRGLNLLFMKANESLEILEESYKFIDKKPDERVKHILKLHEKYIKKYPYMFKNFEEKRILTVSEVESTEWGMIPLLHKNLWGVFNPAALNEDFQLEFKEDRKKPKKRRPEKLNKQEEETVEEDLIDTYTDEEGIVDLD
jgi:hypothetical protein